MKVNFGQQCALLALRFGSREALVNVERGRRYTFRQLHLLTNRIVNMVRDRLGLRRGDFYLTILENDNLSLLHHWTIFKGESTAVWTNYRDSVDEHAWQMDFVKPRVVFLEIAKLETHLEMLHQRGITVVCMDPPPTNAPEVLDFWELIENV